MAVNNKRGTVSWNGANEEVYEEVRHYGFNSPGVKITRVDLNWLLDEVLYDLLVNDSVKVEIMF